MDVAAINRSQKIAIYDDGSVATMQHFVDRFGDETDDPQEAISAIAPMPDGRWAVIDLTKFDPVASN